MTSALKPIRSLFLVSLIFLVAGSFYLIIMALERVRVIRTTTTAETRARIIGINGKRYLYSQNIGVAIRDADDLS